MAAGLGYIEFATGDVLTAATANGYLASQTVMVFASAAARTSAIASPQEGMFSYLKDTNATEYYTGSAWTALGGGGGGKVLQVVYGMYNTQTLINNAGYTDTGLSLSITPSSASSKVLVLTSNFVYYAESSGNPGIGTQIVRTSTAVYEQHPTQNSLAIVGPASGNRGLLASVNMQYLDSPSTTSATTYKTQAKSNCAAYLQWDGGKSNIILMEIGA